MVKYMPILLSCVKNKTNQTDLRIKEIKLLIGGKSNRFIRRNY